MLSRKSYIAASRFGLGIRPDEIDIIADKPKTWLKDQISKGQKSKLPRDLKNSEEIVKEYMRRDKMKGSSDRKELRKDVKNLYMKEFEARYSLAVKTKQPFIERLVWFWGNHFTVSIQAKRELQAIAGSFEREAIRPNVLGKFSDMLLAVETHPAMLFYLDNLTSIGPNSPAGKKAGKGLNENLAREILELHTLGVNGGYNQDDVIGLAKIITGWTIVPPERGGGGFKFRREIHEPGTHILLGEEYRDKGFHQGKEALETLATHPSTAKFIATKLARYFINDNPPRSAIDRLERVFLRTGGDLKQLAYELIDMNETWDDAFSKIKTPEDMVVSSLRIINAGDDIEYDKVLQSLRLMDNLPYSAPSPAGWPDDGDRWMSPNALMERMEWCHLLADILGDSLDRKTLTFLANNIMGRIFTPTQKQLVSRSMDKEEGLALLLASPAFQRR